ncbi:MAG: hypothetical protein WC382_10990 [Methanoregulaceae archaeon]|jgi:hypothetical protein
MKDTLFQAGVIFGRITQLCVERGVVTADPGIALADLLVLFSEELGSLPLSEKTRGTIAHEIHDLSSTLTAYEKDQRLNPDDARTMISLVSRWTDMLLDEFINDSQAMRPPVSSGRDDPRHPTKEPGYTTTDDPVPDYQDSADPAFQGNRERSHGSTR